mmetsp:Transcript_17441/g.40540  ORF Transcript_17441/g.40540 Transcript_17441/m.40540 type:complete len:154 (-) Transcript_17441:1158-1619(-)
MIPLPCTICSMIGLLCLPTFCLDRIFTCGTVPLDDTCCGCGPSLCSCACACPPCAGYFRHLFQTRMEHYLRSLTSKTRPKKILVCMIYYPDENSSIPSWAGGPLAALGYNSNPEKLQTLIRKTFQEATRYVPHKKKTLYAVNPLSPFSVSDEC